MPLKENPDDTLDELMHTKARIEELPDDDDDEDLANEDNDDIGFSGPPFPGRHLTTSKHALPPWLQIATINLIHNDLTTATSESQQNVTAECLPLLLGKDTQGLELNSRGIPRLRRQKHAEFLHGTLGNLPAPYQVVDASRPWLFYWALAGLSFLGEDVSQYRERLIETVRPLKNLTGGFGGGHGQLSHCACSYATLLALAAVGGLDCVDRKQMWHWLGSIKQADGGFRMATGAEEDIRGAYCAMTIITLLNLPLALPPGAPARSSGLETFTDKLGAWVGSCQTYEGGIAAAPGNEAHGAYAFCALACLSILDAPQKSIPKYLDVQALLSCLAGLQTSPEGGFAGRTNKLVDACYSHWVGGCWALVEAALSGGDSAKDTTMDATTPELWSREGLTRYLLCCGQQPGKKGGMRDKPSARPDGYHTCYSLAGLSAAQNRYRYITERETIDHASGRLMAAFNWEAEKVVGKTMVFDEQDRVEFVHPVFVLPMHAVERAKAQFESATLV